jgi:hypothetical protein
MPGYLGFGGPQVQELSFEQSDHGLALVLSHALLQEFEEEKLYRRAPIFLLDRIDQASFQFLGLDEQAQLTGWTNEWAEPGKMPVAVSLEIEFEEEVFTSWPLLSASVRVDFSALQGLVPGEENEINPSSIRNLMIMNEMNKNKKK